MASLASSIPWHSLPSPSPPQSLSESLNLPSSFLPSPTSSLHLSLLSTSRQLTQIPTTSTIKKHLIIPRELLGVDELNELIWSESRIDWFTQGTLTRTFNYSTLLEPITLVKIVQFQLKEPSTSSSPSPASEFDLNEGVEGVWGPYNTSAMMKGKKKEWSDEILKLPTEPPFPSSSSQSSLPLPPKPLKPYLLIILSTLAFLEPLSLDQHSTHQQGGGEEEGERGIPIHLPFKVSSIRSLQGGGVVFERAKEGNETRVDYELESGVGIGEGGLEGTILPVWWSLSCETGAYGELKPVLAVVIGEEGDGHGEVMRDLEERMVEVSNDYDEEEGGLKVGVTVNEKEGKVRVWSYETIGTATGTNSRTESEGQREDVKGKGKGKARQSLDPMILMKDVELSPPLTRRSTRTRSSRPSTSATPSGGDISHSSAASKRRTSAAHRLDTSLSLFDSLSQPLPHAPPSSSLRRSHTLSHSPEINRRTSLTRNDLSVTMDRMALSQGSSVGGGNANVTIHNGLLGLVGEAGEMDREATMFFGEEEWVEKQHLGEGEGKSEVRFKCVWEGELDGTSAKGIGALLFDQRSKEEATLAILLPSTSSLLLLSLTATADGIECKPMKQVEGVKDICTIKATRPRVKDLLLLKNGGGLGVVSQNGIELELSEGEDEAVEGIESDGGKRVLLSYKASDGEVRRKMRCINMGLDELSEKVMETLAQVLKVEEFEGISRGVLGGHTRGSTEGFERVKGTLEGVFGIAEEAKKERVVMDEVDSAFLNRLRRPAPSSSTVLASFTPTSSTVNFTSSHYAILLSLHLLVQSLRLRISTIPRAKDLAKLVVRLSSAIGARGWVDEYRRTWGDEVAGFGKDLTSPTSPPLTGLLSKTPPNILVHLFNLLSCATPPDSTPFSLSSVAQLFCSDSPSFYYGSHSNPLAPLTSVVEIYTLLSPASSSSPTSRAHQSILKFHELGDDMETLKDLHFGIGLPIREAMRSCQLEPMDRREGTEEKWDGVWELIGRRELERFPRPRISSEGNEKPEVSTLTPDIDDLVRQVEEAFSETNLGTTKSKAVSNETVEKLDLNPIPRAARFNEDKRLEEVARMLQYVEPVIISPGDKTLDQLTPQVQQSILNALSHRTLALPIGAGMYHLASHRQSSSDSLGIPKINTSARIIPMPSPVALAEKDRDPTGPAVPDRSEWPDFHSGVAAALRSKLDGIDSSQISFNRPGELDARHAGLLMGLGLNGQLGSMLSSQAYDYLKAKHDPTSVGILLGLAVTYLGTSDPTVTSVISIHLPALHPPRSSSLNVSGMTKSAAAVALGLLHFGTGRRSFADVMVREMCGVKVTNVEDAAACREAYSLSCGFAFGYIMLGKGGKDSAATANEVDLLRVFRALILGENNRPLPGAFYSATANAPTDVNITSSAATVGLALMFIRSERQDVANIFEIPDSPRRLDYVRSDILLLRSLCQSLVVWNSITPSKEWIESGLPKFLVDAAAVQALDPNKQMDPEWEVARWSIIAGACFAVGFKFAGTATAEAHATLIHYMDRLTRACYVKAVTVQSKIKRHSLRTCLGVVAIALSMVMAGTGELNVLRRLRVAHGHFSEGLAYGYHLSTHMALGLLFLGEARYTLSNSNGAIATLLLALYPSFPSTSTDNRAHLQAYRHLWVLAAEPRYLEARDIDSNEPVFLPVRLRLVDRELARDKNNKTELKAKQLVAPTLIPDVRLLDSIQVESPRYWGFTVRLAQNPTQFSRFLRNSTLYVKRRTGHLSYAQDPRGIRSIFTRSKSETGSSVYDFGETARMLNPSAAGLRDFVAAFSDDAEAIAATEQLCIPPDANRPPTAFEAFSASVLLECLTKDKRDIASVYHSIYYANTLLSPNLNPTSDTLLAAEQLRLVVDFYKRGIFKTLFGRSTSTSKSKPPSSNSREPLLNPAFIDHLSSTLSSRIDSISSSSSSSNHLSSYLTFHTWPSSSTSTIPLSLQLAHHAVPDLAALEQLSQLVRVAQRSGVEEGEIAMRIQCTARIIQSTGKKVWSKQVTKLLSQS